MSKYYVDVKTLANPEGFGIVGCACPPNFVCRKNGSQRAVEVRVAVREDSGRVVYSVLTDAGKYYVNLYTHNSWDIRECHAF